MFFGKAIVGFFALPVLCASGLQLPLTAPKAPGAVIPHVQAGAQLDFPAPEQRLASLATDEFTTLSHVAFPGNGVRVKRTQGFCDTTVKAYTGYLDVDFGAKHMFFYFFESRSNPDSDDLMMWLTGGPGCSSAVDMLMQIGPCLVDTEGQGKNGTVFNPYGWNDKLNIFYLDQPVNVGFSYADYGEVVETTEDAAKNVAAFAYIFTEAFSQFKGRPFHMAGSSYGGRYVPVFASEIVDQNKRAAVGGFTPMNLKSIVIGNGMTEHLSMTMSYYDMACTNASVAPVLDISTCVRMKRSLPRCKKMLEEACDLTFDELACSAASLFCTNEIETPFFGSGKNPYDISRDCEGGMEVLCYPIMSKISDYLNRAETRSLIGVDNAVGNFSECSKPVLDAFNAHFDRFKPTQFYISSLLERGVSVLLYVGTYDWICNWVGNTRWAEALEWHGQKEYNGKEFEEWTVDGKRAGMTKGAGGLVFATVEEAGHMVAYNKPAQVLAMLNRWLETREI